MADTTPADRARIAQELLEHVRQQHEVIDQLLARVCALDENFFPSQWARWDVIARTPPLIAKAEAILRAPSDPPPRRTEGGYQPCQDAAGAPRPVLPPPRRR